MSGVSSDIPGFYYDGAKRRYFRILPTAHNADRESDQSRFITSENVRTTFNANNTDANRSTDQARGSKRRLNVSRAHVLESMRTNSMRTAANRHQLVRSSADCRAALATIETSALRERCRVNVARAARADVAETAASSLPGRRGKQCECTQAYKLVADLSRSRMLIVARSGCATHLICGLYRLALSEASGDESSHASRVLTAWAGPSSRFLAFALVRDDVIDACALHFGDDSSTRHSVYLAASSSSVTVYSHQLFSETGRYEVQVQHVAAPGDTLRCCAASRSSHRVAVCGESECRVLQTEALRGARCLADAPAVSCFRMRNALSCAFFDQALPAESADELLASNTPDAVLFGTKSGTVALCDARDSSAAKKPSLSFEHNRAIAQVQPLRTASSCFVVASDYSGLVSLLFRVTL